MRTGQGVIHHENQRLPNKYGPQVFGQRLSCFSCLSSCIVLRARQGLQLLLLLLLLILPYTRAERLAVRIECF